jgi:hypothetical protein
MNERIGQLAEQAGLLGPGSRIGNSHDATERFAELIVRDCMLICEDVMKKDNSALGCWSEIKRTFRS